MLKSDFLEPIPRLENAQIGSPETHFVDFKSQGQTMLKSDLLELILATSGAKAKMLESDFLELISSTSVANAENL